jgi:hypothetical protein
MPQPHARVRLPRRLPVGVLSSLTVVLVVGACRTTDENRVVVRTTNTEVEREAIVDRERVPGGRPSGLGDPRRYPEGEATLRATDPRGSYDLVFTGDDKPKAGTMVVTGNPGALTGRVTAVSRPEATIRTITASGARVTVTADAPNGVLLLRFRTSRDSLHGDWSWGGESGRLVGAYRGSASR